MLFISKPDFIVNTIIGRQNISASQYRWSAFVIKKEIQDGLLCYNTLTCELILVPHSEYNELFNNTELISKWFLVPINFDEYELAKNAKRIRQTIYRADKSRKWNCSINKYWILTTTNCNAKCFYCHEKGIPHKHMNKETAVSVVNYIEHLSKDKQVHIMWYGGEPLINSEAIDIISKGLKEKGIIYTSSMISNGFEFNQEMIEMAASQWHLNEVQITIDGEENTYNRTKAYKDCKGCSPFIKVIENIGMLLSQRINVHVRLNIDSYNQEELFDLSDYLISKFGSSSYFSIYSAPLLEECLGTTYKRNQLRRKEVYDAHCRLSKHLDSSGVLLKTELPKAMRSEMRCIAVSDVRVIFPDGQLAFCHDYSEGVLSGDIFGNEPLEEERLQYTVCLPETELCNKCVKYPQCIRFEKCFKNKCNDELIDEWIWYTEQEMIWEYEKATKKSNHQIHGGYFLETH